MSDERGVIVNWLVKVVLGLALAGAALFDTSAIVWNYLALDSAANDIAVAMSAEIVDDSLRSRQEMQAEAASLALAANAKLLDVVVDRDGILRLKLERTAQTLLVGLLEVSREWAVATAVGKASVR